MNSTLKQLIHPILLGIIAVLVYHPIVHNSFSGLDDVILVEEKWDYLSEISYIPSAFSEDVFLGNENFYYRPLLTVSYMWDVIISHSSEPIPSVFFYTNLFLLTLIGILIYSFLGNFDLGAKYRFTFSALYLLHPILPSMVAWIPGRNDLLLIVFVLSSLDMLAKYFRTGNRWNAIGHVAFFTLAIFTKETGALIPIVGFFIFLYLSNWDWSTSQQKALAILKKFFTEHKLLLLNWVLISSIYFVLRNHALSEKHFSFFSSFASIFRGIPDLLPLLQASILPLHLHVFQSFVSTSVLPTLALIFAFGVFIWKIQPSRKNLLFGGLWFLIFLVPTLISSLIMFHRLALPIIGFAFILSPLEKLFEARKITLFALITIIAVFYLSQNFQFQKAFSSPSLYWKSALSSSPKSALAMNGMAWSFHQQNELDSAVFYYQKVLQLDSSYPGTRIAMALISEKNQKYAQTDSLLNEEMSMTSNPEFVAFYTGQILLERGDTLIAIPSLKMGQEATTYSRNARVFYRSLPEKLKEKIRN
jgi:hypothetical protein